MALRNGWPAVSGSPTQFDIRQDLRALVFRDASGNVRSGIIPPVASPLVTPNSNMTVAIAPFSAVIDRGGPVLLCNDAAATSPTFGAAPSANSRIDLLWVKQQEAASPISDSTDGPIFGVTAGTASATPTAPSAPAGALPLYTAQIPAGASTMASSGVVLAPVFPYTAVGGCELWVRSSTELGSITPIQNQKALDLSTGLTWTYGGSGWSVSRVVTMAAANSTALGAISASVQPFLQTGSTVVSLNSTGFGNFSWPTPFPNGVIACVAVSGDSAAHDGAVTIGSAPMTNAACYVHCVGHAAGPVRINWIALGW